MNINDFETFINFLEENIAEDSNIFNFNKLFPCDKCHKVFKYCSYKGDLEECSKKFQIYAKTKNKLRYQFFYKILI